jgi:hypothetical protein
MPRLEIAFMPKSCFSFSQHELNLNYVRFSTNVSWNLSREIVNSSKVKLRGKTRVTYCKHFHVVFRLFNFFLAFHAAMHDLHATDGIWIRISV